MKKFYENRFRECPCHNCICIPACRQRWFQPMLRSCESICDYLYNDPKSGTDPDLVDDYYDRMQTARMIIFSDLYRREKAFL